MKRKPSTYNTVGSCLCMECLIPFNFVQQKKKSTIYIYVFNIGTRDRLGFSRDWDWTFVQFHQFLNCLKSVFSEVSFLTVLNPYPLNFPPIFEHFPIVWFGWNFLHRFILGWHLWGLHFFLSKFPYLHNSSPTLKIFPLLMNTFPSSDLDEASYVGINS